MQRRSPKSLLVDDDCQVLPVLPTVVASPCPPPKIHALQQHRVCYWLCVVFQLIAHGAILAQCYSWWLLTLSTPPLPDGRGHSQHREQAIAISGLGLVMVKEQQSLGSTDNATAVTHRIVGFESKRGQGVDDAPTRHFPVLNISNGAGPFTGTASSNFVAVDPLDDISNNAQYRQFFETHCDFGVNPVALWPNGDIAWQRRAPNFLILGAKKAGTSSYWGKLIQHPYIIVGKTKEMHSFQSNALGQWGFPSRIGNKIKMDEARRTLYNVSTSLYPMSALKQDPRLISLDATPDYLLLSDISPHVLLCTAPWVKLLVTLRDPVERLFSNYNFMLQNVPALRNVTFEQWVERDMETLRLVGVIDRDDDERQHYQQFRGQGGAEIVDEEQVNWKHDQILSTYVTQERPVGRSLYVLQLEAWLRWLRAAGRDPSSTLRVVWQDDLRQSPNATLNHIANWLGLPDHPFNTHPQHDLMITNYSTTLATATRARLETFFAPYNQRLAELLQREQITFAPP
jgi:hypothetical protein